MVISGLDDEQSTEITTDDYWKKELCYLATKAKDYTKSTKDDLRRDLEAITNKTGPSVNTNPLTPPEVIGNPTGDGQICEKRFSSTHWTTTRPTGWRSHRAGSLAHQTGPGINGVS
jgi:hypothetical protein